MANFTTSADLLDDILDRAGELTDGTSDFNAAAIRHLNSAYQGILGGGSELDPTIHENWWWMRTDDQGVLTLNPVISAGTINVTNNSTSVTFSSGPTPSVAGRHFKVDDHADVFIISAHSGGATSATLESVYTGGTNTAVSYRVMQLDYDLNSSLIALTQQMTSYQDGRQGIPGITLAELDRKWPKESLSSGVPRNFAMIGDQKVRFSHYGGTSSTDLIKVDYEYSAEPADLADDSNEPIVPRIHRRILSNWALSLLLEEKGDNRAGSAGVLAQRGLQAMKLENRKRLSDMSEGFGKIYPRLEQLQRFKGPLRTESGLIIG